MRRPRSRTARRCASALALALIVGAAGLAPAADPGQYRLKPGAEGKLCLSCHVDFEETMSRPHVHTPVAAGNCSDCHDPHASDHGQLLAADPNAICGTCHDDLVPASPRSAHDAVTAGRCTDCHDPHASSFDNGLRAEGNALCLGCHEDLAGALAAAENRHAPVEADCMGCHTPHASADTPALLARAVPGLCVECHDPAQDAFRRDHMGYPVGGSNCSSCHDPHGSSHKGLLWADVHEPVSRKMCSQCHAEPGAPDALDAKRPGAELCRGCHNETFNATFSKSRLHWPVVDREACSNCHAPHASKVRKLLAAPEGELCGSCHQDTMRRQSHSKVSHEPNAEGACGTCHDPHASNLTSLLVASPVEVCGTCHDWGQHSAHPMGEDVVNPRNPNLAVDCLSCHRTHGTEFDKLAHFDPKQELCTQCHSGIAR